MLQGIILRQSTAIVVPIGPAIEIADFIASVNDLAAGTVDALVLWKQGDEAFADISGEVTLATVGHGRYKITLSETHTNTVGFMQLVVRDDSEALQFEANFQVVTQAIYDANYGPNATPAPAFILAAQATLSTSQVIEQDVTLVQYSTGPVLVWYVTDADGNPVDVEAAYDDIRLDVFDGRTGEIAFTLSLSNGITISGDNNDQIWVDREVEHVSEVTVSKHVLWGIAEPTAQDVPLRTGAWEIVLAAKSGPPVSISAAYCELDGPSYLVVVRFNGPLTAAVLEPTNWRIYLGTPHVDRLWTGPTAVAIDGSRVVAVFDTDAGAGYTDFEAVKYGDFGGQGLDLVGDNGDAVVAFEQVMVKVT